MYAAQALNVRYMMHVELKAFNDWKWPAIVKLNGEYVGTLYFKTEQDALDFKAKVQ